MRASKARAGRRAGQACHRRWSAYGSVLPSRPEVGAVCGKAARTDLCGGREVTRVPTATAAGVHRVGWCRGDMALRNRRPTIEKDRWGASIIRTDEPTGPGASIVLKAIARAW